mgnify:CR=1 FL=1|tara:strand:- start:14315 stop:14704 length:390 start_codon:yes stop_codon:yes gene_type:complete
MANPTMASQGSNREVHCATAKFTWNATGASTYTSGVMVPSGAQILSVGVRAGATGEAVPGTGTSITVKVGGVAVSAAIDRNSNYDAVGDSYTAAAIFYTDAGLDNGAIGVTTVGTHDAGNTYVTVCYVV